MKKTSGQILPVVMITLVILTLIISGLISWIQNDSKISVKQSKSTSVVNFAEAGIDRGTWKLQSTTSTWAQASAGTVVGGYNFDTTYTDIPGGTYRIKFASGIVNSQPAVTVTAEGRDSSTNVIRAIAAQYVNQTIYSPLMAGGSITWAKGLGIFWGPIMSQGDILLQDDVVGAWYYPRKYAKGVVVGPPSGNFPRDVNGLLTPNTDGAEWWTEYQGVPSVPILDFTALRSSAAATNTLNVYGCQGSGAAWDLGACPSGNPHATHFGDSTNYITTHPPLAANKDYVWFWDGNLTLTGSDCGGIPCGPPQGTGLRGTVVVLGDLTINSTGDLVYNGHVPANAWQEHQKLTINTNDTAASNEYPADTGLHQ